MLESFQQFAKLKLHIANLTQKGLVETLLSCGWGPSASAPAASPSDAFRLGNSRIRRRTSARARLLENRFSFPGTSTVISSSADRAMFGKRTRIRNIPPPHGPKAMMPRPTRCLIPDFDGAHFSQNGGMHYVPGSPWQRHDDRGGPSNDITLVKRARGQPYGINQKTAGPTRSASIAARRQRGSLRLRAAMAAFGKSPRLLE
ncbi:hypothetical protein FHS85_004689 [Rhodoligotrophos appendicifer]